MPPLNRNSTFNTGASWHGGGSGPLMMNGMSEGSGRSAYYGEGRRCSSSRYSLHGLDTTIHGRSKMPLADALGVSIHGCRGAFHTSTTSASSSQSQEKNEFEMIMAIIEEGKAGDMEYDEVVAMFEENKSELPPFLVEFVENRLVQRFQRNMNVLQDAVQIEVEEFIEDLLDEEEIPSKVLASFAQRRFTTFARNMATIGLFVLQGPNENEVRRHSSPRPAGKAA